MVKRINKKEITLPIWIRKTHEVRRETIERIFWEFFPAT